MAVRTKKKRFTSGVETQRQNNMIRLMQRYARQVYEPATLVHFHSWSIGYLNIDTNIVEFEHEFKCYSNNAAFVCMLFEAAKLPVKVAISYIEYNNLVQ